MTNSEELPNQEGRRAWFLSAVGEAVKAARGSRGLSLRGLSAECGVSHRALWRIEHAKTDPRLSTLFLVSEALKTPVAEFVFEQLGWGAEEDKVAMTVPLPVDVVAALDAGIVNALLGDSLVAALTDPNVIANLRDKMRAAWMITAMEEARKRGAATEQ